MLINTVLIIIRIEMVSCGAGPVWDFNYGFGLVGGTPDWRSQPANWQFENGNNG